VSKRKFARVDKLATQALSFAEVKELLGVELESCICPIRDSRRQLRAPVGSRCFTTSHGSFVPNVPSAERSGHRRLRFLCGGHGRCVRYHDPRDFSFLHICDFFPNFMCGRYRRTTSEEELARLYHIPIQSQTDLPISYNIAPSQRVLTIRFNPQAQQRCSTPCSGD
jgi:hypothetical protein